MAGNHLNQLLDRLELRSNNAVFFSNEKDGQTYPFFTTDIQNKLELIKPDAFFVFNNQPYILFFDLSSLRNVEREQQIHKQVWSFDYSPLIFLIRDDEIQIFNAFSFDKKKKCLREIKLSDESRDNIFSFWNLQSGESWRWLEVEQYKSNIQKKRVNQKLFENIRLVREMLTSSGSSDALTEADANILILRLIFVRYLIDRDVKMDADYIIGNSIFERRRSFGDLIEKPRKLNEFFEQLNHKFNGALFKDIKVQISKVQAKSLSWVFNGKDLTLENTLFDGIDFYFDIFDFSIIPVEVISGIYESLISPENRDEQSAVYTPAFLVEHMLSETVDKHLEKKKSSECSVFDPSCGSGIFLVQAYRRMVDREKHLKGDKISKVRLREIAQNNLFGIDINEQSLNVSCFSIYIAILDYQDPRTILDNFQFPALIDENLFVSDFFDTNHSFNATIKSKKVDFILGNPPWKRDKSDLHLDWVNEAGIYNKKIVGELEIAQSFLMRCKDYMHYNTIAAIIVTSTVFNNISTTSKEFKRSFLTTFCMDRFFDLSPVRRLIFEEKDNPASIVHFRLSEKNRYLTNTVKHLSIKSNIFLKYFKTLIIEKFDQKEIQQRHFLENNWMFKLALYGNTLDFIFLKKLQKTNKQILDLFDGSMMFKGAGIHKGTQAKYSSFDSIIGKPIIENYEVEKYYSRAHSEILIKKNDSYIKSGREKGLYEGTQILIKEQAKDESEIVISLADKSYVFKSGVFSLSSKDEDKVLHLYSIMISMLYEYFVFITSGSWGISTRPQIRLDDEFLAFPFLSQSQDLQKRLIKLVRSLRKTFKEYHAEILRSPSPPIPNDILTEINEIVNSSYSVEGYEKDIMDYVLNISRYQFQESKQHKFTKKVDNDVELLKQYASVIYNELNIYDEYLKIEIYPLNYFIAMNFIYSKEKPDKELVFITENSNEKEILKRIAGNLTVSKLTDSKNSSKSLYVQKDIKGYEKDSFYIIKPNEYKCWHRAMAWYDVAEIREAIEKAELAYLKGGANV